MQDIKVYHVKLFNRGCLDGEIVDVVEYKQENNIMTLWKSDGRVIFVNLDKADFVVITKE